MLKIIELFAGIGSQTQALKNIGVEHKVVAISEFDKYADASYKAIHGEVNNMGDITKITQLPPADLWTYSFPCQDISLAGKQKGLTKDSGTRSGLLWEVERLLLKAKETNTLPKYLLMENVKNLVSKRFKPEFDKWLEFLQKLGYCCFYQVLNAKDYGIPQNRERVFMVSILGNNAKFEFPKPFPLKLRLKDLLEKEVDEKYYLSKKMIDYVMARTPIGNNSFKGTNNLIGKEKEKIAGTLTTSSTIKPPDNYIIENMTQEEIERKIFLKGNQQFDYNNKHLRETLEKNEINDGNFIDAFNRNVREDTAGTISTKINTNNESFVVVKDTENYIQWKEEGNFDCCCRAYKEDKISGTITCRPDEMKVVGNYSPSGHNASRVVDPNGLAPTVMENHGTTTVAIKNATKQGYLIAEEEEDGIDISGRMETHRGTVQKGISQTLTTQCDVGVLQNLRIRKLTPKECWRLMGFSDEAYEKASKVVSSTQLYKQAGNSIVVNVLEEIFKQMFLVEYPEYYNSKEVK